LQERGNVTGFALVTEVIKTLQISKEIAPAISRVAYVCDPDAQPPRAVGEARLNQLGVGTVRLLTNLLFFACMNLSRL
jgi:hypothetical protein